MNKATKIKIIISTLIVCIIITVLSIALVKKYTPTKSRKTKIIKIEGMEFSNMTEACKYFNISRTSVYERMGRLKVSREEAITYYINKQKSKITPP